MFRVCIRAEFVVPAADVLDKSVSGANHPSRTKPFKATHRPQSSLKPSVICFDDVIAVLLSEMASSGHQLIQHTRIGRCLVRGHRTRVAAVIQSQSKESTSGRQVPLLRHQYIDDLAILVDRSVQVDPAPGDFHIRFISKPTITRHMPAGPGRVDQQRSKPLHPTVNGHMIDRDPAFSQQLLHVPESPYRRYHRTATRITSGGNRKPAKLDPEADTLQQRRGISPACRSLPSLNATGPTPWMLDRDQIRERILGLDCSVRESAMGREVWGAYSVRDHLEPHPWAADVLLYDRLAIPVPPDLDDPEGPAEWRRWSDEGWEPERQQQLISILGNAAYPIPWNQFRRHQWSDLHGAALGTFTAQISAEARRPSAANPWLATAMVVERGLPSRVTAVTAVATYRSADQLAAAVRMREVDPAAPLPAGQAVVVIGREFLIPDPAQFGSNDDLLRAAVELSSDGDYRRRRVAYWRWQREFLNDGMFIDAESIEAAVAEMQDLIADEHRSIRRRQIRLVTMFAMCVAAAGATVLAGPLAPVTLAAAFLSVGQFVAGEALAPPATVSPSPAGLLITGRKDLGWRG